MRKIGTKKAITLLHDGFRILYFNPKRYALGIQLNRTTGPVRS
jgi:hypothetical protein